MPLSHLDAKNAAPAETAIAITANASAFAAGPCRALYVGGQGDVTCTMQDGSSVVFTAVIGILPVRVIAMTAATATGVVALY